MVERRTQVQRSSESRQRLIDATIRLLAERGYAHTSLAAIGAQAGLSRGLVSHHFGSKEACMQAVVDHIRQQIIEQANKANAIGPSSVDDVIDLYFNAIRAQEPAARAMYVILIEGLTSSPRLGPAVAATNALSRQFIVGLLTDSAENEAAPADSPTAESLAVLILGILRGVALEYLADPSQVDLDAAVNLTKAMIHHATDTERLSA